MHKTILASDIGITNSVHLCLSCAYNSSDCDEDPKSIILGSEGVNVCCCSSYDPKLIARAPKNQGNRLSARRNAMYSRAKLNAKKLSMELSGANQCVPSFTLVDSDVDCKRTLVDSDVDCKRTLVDQED